MQAAALSQAEIDALLSNLGTRETAEEPDGNGASCKSVKPYDFRRPDKFSKDQVRALQILHESFARIVGPSMSARLRTIVQVNLASVDQGAYNEYVELIPGSTILAIVDMEPLPGNIILELSADIAHTMIDRLLGGSGLSARRSTSMTDIEIALLKRVIGTMVKDIGNTWSNIIELTPRLNEIILNPRFIQANFQGDVVIVLVFEMKVGETTGKTTLCIPYSVLEPIMPKLNAQSWFMSSHKSRPADSVAILRNEMQKVRIPVSVVLGTTDVHVEELLAIQVGDVIRLDSRVGRDLEVAVAGSTKYLAQPGKSGNRLAARITRILDEREAPTVVETD